MRLGWPAMLQFVQPDDCYRQEHTDMMDEWHAGGGGISPWPLLEAYRSDTEFEAVLRLVNAEAPAPGYAPSKTWWVRDTESGKLIGAVNIHAYLTKAGFETFGHIGYGVRPSEHWKGYATQMLQTALERCRAMDLWRVLLGCADGNIASIKTIEKCGGNLENIVCMATDGKQTRVRRYWIDL